MKVLCEVCRAQGKVIKQTYYLPVLKKPYTFSTIDYYYQNNNYKLISENKQYIRAYWPAYDLNNKPRATINRIKSETCPECNGKCIITQKQKEKYEPDYCI